LLSGQTELFVTSRAGNKLFGWSVVRVHGPIKKGEPMRVRRLLSLRRDLVIMVALPLVTKGVSVAARELRTRRGPSRAADRLDQAERLLRKVQRFF
jgi:hypothetical protein